MSLINFPSTPALNDVYEINGITYIWDGTKWATNTSSFDPIRVNIPGDTMTGNTDVTTINELTWPAVDGTAGQVMTTNGSGQLGYSDVDGWQFLSGGAVSGSGNVAVWTGFPSTAKIISIRLFNMGHSGISPNTGEIMSISMSDSNVGTTVQQAIGHSHLQLGATPYHWDAPVYAGIPLPFFGGGQGGDAEIELQKFGVDSWIVAGRGISDAGYGPFITAGIIIPNIGPTPFDSVRLVSALNFRSTGVEAYAWFK